MENVMKGLFGSGGETGPADKDKARDFVNRYENGDPTEGYSKEEAVEYFGKVAKNAPPETMQNAVRQSVSKLNPDQRKEFATMLQQRKSGQVDRPMTDNAPDDVDNIMGSLLGGGSSGAGGIGDILGGLLGGGGSSGRQSGQGGGIDDLLGGLLGGGGGSRNAGAVEGQGGGGGGLGDILGSSVGKAVLAGAAAFAMKELIDKN